MKSTRNLSRRGLLQSAGAAVPTLRLMEAAAAPTENAKFTPVDLSAYFNTSSAGFGPRERARQMGGPSGSRDGLIRTPGGKRSTSWPRFTTRRSSPTPRWNTST